LTWRLGQKNKQLKARFNGEETYASEADGTNLFHKPTLNLSSGSDPDQGNCAPAC
jgi:hypothetical protein